MISPTQTPEGWGCLGADMMIVNRPDFILVGWWNGLVYVGSVSVLGIIAVFIMA